jgi:hypothetical protein
VNVIRVRAPIVGTPSTTGSTARAIRSGSKPGEPGSDSAIRPGHRSSNWRWTAADPTDAT